LQFYLLSFLVIIIVIMADTAAEKEEKEKRRKKQAKRMGKVLARAWQLDDSEDFQDGSGGSTAVLCLTAIGKKSDAREYRLGRHGWEDFARDLGGVYNRHIHRYATLIDFILTFVAARRALRRTQYSKRIGANIFRKKSAPSSSMFNACV
jgi:hypothetical protein